MKAEARFIEGDWRQKCLAALTSDGYTVHAPGRDGDVTRFMPCESVDAEQWIIAPLVVASTITDFTEGNTPLTASTTIRIHN